MTIVDFFRVIRRRKWLVVLAIALGVSSFAGSELQKPALYTASAQVLLNDQTAANLVGLQTGVLSTDAANRFAETQKLLARVPEVARRALKAAGVRARAEDFLRQSSVSAAPGQDLLDFNVTNRSSALAIRLATEYARQFPIYRRELDTESLRQAQQEVRGQLALARASGGTQSPLFQSLSARLEQLNTLAALQTTSAQLVRPADHASQVQPHPLRASVIGLALGLLVGVALALLRDATDTRLRSATEIAEALDVPLLARIPPPPKGVWALVSLEKPASIEAEAFRILRTNLEFATLERDAKTVMITSGTAGEGKSTTAANLAVALAKAGTRVTVVDLDLRQPGISRLFDVKNGPGITDVALKRATLRTATTLIMKGAAPGESLPEPGSDAQRLDEGSLHFVGAGTAPPDPGAFIASRAFADILAGLKRRSDVVLIDAAPLLSIADTMALTDQVDAVLVVVRLSSARRPMVEELKRVLDSSPVSVLGVAVTDVSVPPYEHYISRLYLNSARSSAEAEAEAEFSPRLS
jgi:succinoglycan biosynthesis transport protein ExoP